MNKLKEEFYELIKADESLFDFIQESALSGMWYWNLENPKEGWINDQFWLFLGYEKDQIPTNRMEWRNQIHPDDLKIVNAQLQEHLKNPLAKIEHVARYQHKNGHDVWVKIKGQAIRNEAGVPVRLFGVHIDVTEEKRKEKLLMETSEAARIGAWEYNLITQSLYWSPITKAIHEVEEDFAPNVETGINFYKEGYSRDTISKLLEKAISSGEGWDVELQLVTTTGKEIWVRAIGNAEMRDGQCTRLFGVFQDIDARKKAELSEKKANERLSLATKAANIGIWDYDIVHNKLTWDDQMFKLYGIERSEFLGEYEAWQAGLHPDDKEKGDRAAEQAIAGDAPFDTEFRVVWPDKTIRIIRAIATVERDTSGNAIRMVGVNWDVTEQREKDYQIKKEREFLQTLIDNLPVNVYVKDLESRKTMINRKELEHIGVKDITEVLGKSDMELYPSESAKKSREEDLKVFETGEGFVDIETENVKKDGEKNYFLTSKLPLHDKDGSITGLLGISYNVTKHKEAEEKIRNYSILESKAKEMEQFAYIASHDLREPLLTIKGYTNLFQEDYENILDEDAKMMLDTMNKTINRMDALIHGLLDYSRLSKVDEMEVVEVEKVLQEVITDMEVRIEESGAKISYGELPTLNVYKTRFHQLFQNLFSNAIKFRKKGIAPKITIHTEKIERGWQFEVRDNGIGMEKKGAEKIFNLFSRLHRKEDYAGTGIGLANCKKIIELHNGRIWVESVLDEGSSFYFTIMTEE